MPEMTAARRAQGGHVAVPAAEVRDDIDWTNPANWTAATLRHRRLPVPDQTRYGTATTDPAPRHTDGSLKPAPHRKKPRHG